ncbi:MAG: hypothetical protein HYS13_24080 [Planctomycetia bacterium]|nr:hypothetical protein [Planctomycetia bacterium]
MKAYETAATVGVEGEVRVGGVPFAPGTEVEVTISQKRGSADEFAAAWQRVCREMRSRLPNIGDEEIQKEIDEHRAGK